MSEQLKDTSKIKRLGIHGALRRVLWIALVLFPISWVCYAVLGGTWRPWDGTEETSRHFREWMLVLLTAIAVVFLTSLLTLPHWLGKFFCWQNYRRAAFGLACFATLAALFYAEEDWRGWHDWTKYKSDWGAKGEKFEFADFVPPPVPDDQNFAMAPLFDTTRKLANRKWRDETLKANPRKSGDWNFGLVDPLQMQLTANNDWPTNGGGSWARATLTDLKPWQDYYRKLASRTNMFPVAPQPQTPAQDVLLALSKYDATIEELRQASLRPDSRWPLDYDDECPAEILLPHLASLKGCVHLLELRALAELQNGQSDRALADVKLSLSLQESIRTEPFIISQLVRFACFQITLQPIYQGLAEHNWSDTQLAELESELKKVDFLAGYLWSVRGERAAHAKVIDWLEQKRSRYWALEDMQDSSQQAVMNNFWRTMQFYLMPKGWFDQNKIRLAQFHQEFDLPMVNDEQHVVLPQKAALTDKAVEKFNKATPYNVFVRLLLPSIGGFARRTAQGQTAVDLSRVAVALERYRLAHGQYPESLDALSPQFMAQVPHDVIGGQPLKYRREADGTFVLYSVGWNERDDGGVFGFPPGGTIPKYDLGDVVWRYPQK
jgi:hypothetical protein